MTQRSFSERIAAEEEVIAQTITVACEVCGTEYASPLQADACGAGFDPGYRVGDFVGKKGDPKFHGRVQGFENGHRAVRLTFSRPGGASRTLIGAAERYKKWGKQEKKREDDRSSPPVLRVAATMARKSGPGPRKAREDTCEVCGTHIEGKGNLAHHVGRYSHPGFGVGDSVVCIKRASLHGDVRSVDEDHRMMDLHVDGTPNDQTKRFLVEAFTKAG